MTIEMRGLCPLLSVFDMPTSVQFYCGILEFELVDHSPFYAEGEFHWAMLRRGAVELMLNTAYDEGERPSEPDLARVAAHGDTCLYFGCEDADAVFQRLVEKGLRIEPPKVARYGMKQLYFHDPDGYEICFQHPVYFSAQNATDSQSTAT